MAIYGLNFNRQPIPVEAPKFAKRLDSKFRAISANRGCTWFLQGVCQSQVELDAMLVQANNGYRQLWHTSRNGWFAVYTS